MAGIACDFELIPAHKRKDYPEVPATAMKEYVCDLCGKSYQSRGDLIHHQEFESKGKSQQCWGNECFRVLLISVARTIGNIPSPNGPILSFELTHTVMTTTINQTRAKKTGSVSIKLYTTHSK